MSIEFNNENINPENSSNLKQEQEEEQENIIQTFNTWDDLELDKDLLRGIYAHGFEKPSPIQSKAIKPILNGLDIIAQAQSGTGKTGSFTIGALSKIKISENANQVLIMVPTHELAHQITSVINNLSAMMIGVRVKTIVGGSSIDDDVEEMKKTTKKLRTKKTC